MSNKFSILDMVNDESNDGDINSLFAGNANEPAVKEEVQNKPDINRNAPAEQRGTGTAPVKKDDEPWSPPADVLKDLPEYNRKAPVYEKSEYDDGSPKPLANILEDHGKESFHETMNNMDRIHQNILKAKAAVGINLCRIPAGHPLFIPIMNAAEDNDLDRSHEQLVALFTELKNKFPEDILDRVATESGTETLTEELKNPGDEFKGITIADDKVVIIIDKSQFNELMFTADEIEKIRTSRIIEVNIKEDIDLEFGIIEDSNLSGNALDEVLSQYVPIANSIKGVLPASQYRCEFTGLSYAEVVDLEHSEKLDRIDGLRKKWSIAFSHIKNPSIGEFKSYKYYFDPVSRSKKIVGANDIIPSSITEVHTVSAFDDFLMKTSYIDIEFILWKILCATSQDKELVTIVCNNIIGEVPIEGAVPDADGNVPTNKIRCDHRYDWAYAPHLLLNTEMIEDSVAMKMQSVLNADSIESIQNEFADSPVNYKNIIKLPKSGYGLIYGHASAYSLLNDLYEKINSKTSDDTNNMMPSDVVSTMLLLSVKGFIVPREGAPSIRYTEPDDLIRIINTLDEYDFNIITTINAEIIKPYQHTFNITDIVCPKCNHKSTANIDSIEEMLFIYAQSLTSVKVNLVKR